MACTIDGQVVTIDTLRNLVDKLLREANQVMSNQLLLGLQITSIGRVIAEVYVVDRANEDEVEYSFLSDARNEFHCHGQDLAIHLFNDRRTRGLFVKGTDGDRSIVWNQNALAMWAKAADRMHTLLFLLMHFTAGIPPRGKEYRSYLLRNTKHFDRTFYRSADTIMTFQRYHKGANAGQPVKLIPRFLPPKLNSLFIEYMLLVRPVQSFIAGLRGNMDAARQHMDLWAIQRDVAMDGEDVSYLVATAFLEHVNLDLGIADYRHLGATSAVPSSKVIAQNFPSTRHLGTLRPRPHKSMPIVPTITASWTINKCTRTDWLPKRGIAFCNLTGARSETLRPVVGPTRFLRASTDPMAIVYRNPSARLSSHLSCVRSHRPSLNRPCHHRSRIKRTKCVLCELFVN
jgi:hypothetical protein